MADAFDRAVDDAGTGLAACQETSGFLFKHPCHRRAIAACESCGKLVCEEHSHKSNEGELLCTACLKKRRRRSRNWQSDDTNDPYFYGHRYYPGWGSYTAGYWGYHQYHHYSTSDSHDFTEGDAGSFVEGDEGFESSYDDS
jgi:hypothetical protein